MYYRRGFYPRPGQADVSDDLWAEFQRIRGHMSNLDQNNVDDNTVLVDQIVPPTDIDRNGISDIVDENGEFLYKQAGAHSAAGTQLPTGHMALKNFALSSASWVDLGRYGLTLRAQSRGDAPWIVGVSAAFLVYRKDGVPMGAGDSIVDGYNVSGFHKGEGPLNPWDRAAVRLRVKSSQGGLSAAEAVLMFNSQSGTGTIATVATFIARGGPIEFSPAIQYREIYRFPGGSSDTPETGDALQNDYEVEIEGWDGTPRWGLHVHRANIFAFGLYR